MLLDFDDFRAEAAPFLLPGTHFIESETFERGRENPRGGEGKFL